MIPAGSVAVTEPLTVESVTDSAAPASTVTWPAWVASTTQVRPLLTGISPEWAPVTVVVQVGG